MNGVKEIIRRRRRRDLTRIGPGQLEICLIVHGKGIGSVLIQFESTSTAFQDCVRRLVVEDVMLRSFDRGEMTYSQEMTRTTKQGLRHVDHRLSIGCVCLLQKTAR